MGDPEVCNACSLKSKCTEGKSGRAVNRNFDEEYFEKVKGYYELEAYKKAMRKRKVWIEPMFAETKQWHRMERVRLRRLEKVNTEVFITAAGQNIKRLLNFGGRGPRNLAQAVALRPPERPLLRLNHRRSGANSFLPNRPHWVFQHAAGKLYCENKKR